MLNWTDNDGEQDIFALERHRHCLDQFWLNFATSIASSQNLYSNSSLTAHLALPALERMFFMHV